MRHDTATQKDLARLWKEYKEQKNSEAKDIIAVHYLSLVKFIAGRMALNSPSHVEEDDLIGWGVLGLLDAIEKFDINHSASFETYASTRIRGEIIDQIRSLDWAPRSLRQKARRMEQAKTKLKGALGREPSHTELAAEMEMDGAELFDLMTDIHGAYVLSLDAAVSSEEDMGTTTLEQTTGDSLIPSPEASASRKEDEERLAQAISRLSVNEQQVITLYYYDELTLKEIGEVLALSESRICQIHRSVIKKLKDHLKRGA